jgi:hypothetical protein
MSLEELMDIQVALQQEEARLQKQLNAIQGAISALNGHSGPSAARSVSQNGNGSKRTMSAAGRAKISKAAKARWAKFHAERAKRGK